MNATKITVEIADVISSRMTAVAKSNSDFPYQAKAEKRRFVEAINIPAIIIPFTKPERIANKLPIIVKTTVITQPYPFK